MTAPAWITNSGIIATLNESDSFGFTLLYDDSLAQLEVIAGELPPGIDITPQGYISGTVQPQLADASYQFVIRLSNQDGFNDRGFCIKILNNVAAWNDPSNLGQYPSGSYVEYNFFVTDQGGQPQSFKKISGELPPGLVLNNFGKLYGVIDARLPLTVYSFTLQGSLGTTQTINRSFSITVNPGANAPPIWLTPGGSLGDITAAVPYTQQVLAKSPTSGGVNYTATGLPANLSINQTTGVISGTLVNSDTTIYTFSINANSGISNTSRLFTLNANATVVYGLGWSSVPNSTIGSIKEGQKSLLKITAESDSPWIRYEVVSGSLPAGLEIDVNTGNIWGLVQEQTATSKVSTFTVRAYNESTSITASFKITVQNAYAPNATRVFVTLYGDHKLNYIDLFTTQDILIGNVFQEGNPTLGLINYPKILLAENLDAPTPDQLANLLTGVRRTYLSFGEVEVGKAVINDHTIYEVLYRKILDDSDSTVLEQTNTHDNSVQKPGSLKNLRTRLAAQGFSGGAENLPLWMRSEQKFQDASSAPGWIPCLEFAYVQPGTGQTIANKINKNDQLQQRMFNNRMRVDRIVMEPTASNSFSQQLYFI